MADTRLTIADQVLINAMIVIAAARLGNHENARLAMEVIGETLPSVNRANPKLTALIEAAENICADTRLAFGMSAGRALADVAMWRLGGALEQMKAREETL